MEVIRALLAKGANPNINDMGFTPFLVAAGVSPGGRGGGGGGAPNTTLLDLMIQHGADVNAQVTGTRTYSMRISYNTSRRQRRYVGSPRSGAGGPDGPGSLPSGEGSQSRARRCQRQEADRSARRRRRRRCAEDEAEAELQRLLPQATLRGAEPVPLPPREPEVVAALGVEASTRRLQPRFARCCKTRRRRSSLRGTTSQRDQSLDRRHNIEKWQQSVCTGYKRMFLLLM